MSSRSLEITKIFAKAVGIVAGACFFEKQLKILSEPDYEPPSFITNYVQKEVTQTFLLTLPVFSFALIIRRSGALRKAAFGLFGPKSENQCLSKPPKYVAVDKKHGTLLTAHITVTNPENNITTEAVVIFDTGSQETFITNNLMEKLRLTELKRQNLHLFGIGDMKYASSVVKFDVKTKDGYKEVYANSIVKICKTLPIIQVDEFDLTQTSVIYKKPDILIGIDYFFDFITSFEKANDETCIVDSVVGKIMSKNYLDSQKDTVN